MLVLMRHGPTEWNASRSRRQDDEILRGHFDLPLTKLGVEEVTQNARKLLRYGIHEVWSSSFLRDSQTAAIIADICKARRLIVPQMEPYKIGSLSGVSLSDAWPTMQKLFKNPQLRPPQGESIAEFVARWGPVIQSGREQSRQGKNIVEIVQGTVIRWLPWFLRGRQPSFDKWEYVKPAQMIFLE